MSNKTTQNKEILKWLESGKSITGLEAIERFGCYRLSARIFNLRENGYQIVTKNITKNGKTFAEYSLANPYFTI